MDILIMANPQTEDGFLKIAIELQDALCKIRIPGEARQVLDFIIRKTYGWNKKEDVISLSQFSEATGLIKTHVCRALKKLILMNIITQKGQGSSTLTQKGQAYAQVYMFQKDYDLWRPLPKKITLPKKVKPLTLKGQEPLPKKVITIDRYKDTITKDNLTTNVVIPKSEKAKPKPKKSKAVNKDLTPGIKYFCEKYESIFNYKYDFKGGQDSSLINRMTKNFGLEMFKNVVDMFLQSTDPWLLKVGKSVGTLSTNANKIIQMIRDKETGMDAYSAQTRDNMRVAEEWLNEDKNNDG